MLAISSIYQGKYFHLLFLQFFLHRLIFSRWCSRKKTFFHPFQKNCSINKFIPRVQKGELKLLMLENCLSTVSVGNTLIPYMKSWFLGHYQDWVSFGFWTKWKPIWRTLMNLYFFLLEWQIKIGELSIDLIFP